MLKPLVALLTVAVLMVAAPGAAQGRGGPLRERIDRDHARHLQPRVAGHAEGRGRACRRIHPGPRVVTVQRGLRRGRVVASSVSKCEQETYLGDG